MRKALAIIILLIAGTILVTAMNQAFINRLKQDRYFDHLTPVSQKQHSLYRSIFLRSDKWGYGDLYGVCYIPEYRIKLDSFKAYNNRVGTTPTNRVLYIIGDSFTADKNFQNAFDSFDEVVFLDHRFPFGPVKPDTTKQNYMIMEYSELDLCRYSAANSTEIIGQPPAFKPLPLATRIGNILFNKDLNKNLETVLFDDSVLTPFKELKATINYKLLGRVPNEVAVSTDKSRLFLNSTVDTGSAPSVFRPLSAQRVKEIAGGLMNDRNRYKAMGFKEVYLAITPNAVSVYDNKRMPYNHLLEKVEQATPSIPKIEIYHTFLTINHNLYSRSDAHWNNLGFGTWVSTVNQLFVQKFEGAPK